MSPPQGCRLRSASSVLPPHKFCNPADRVAFAARLKDAASEARQIARTTPDRLEARRLELFADMLEAERRTQNASLR